MRAKALTFIVVLGLALALTASASAQGTAPGSIKAAQVVGSVFVTVKATGTTIALVNGGDVGQGDAVSTAAGSSVMLVFSNGSVVALAENTAMDIAKFTQDPFTTPFSPSKETHEPTTSSTHLDLVKGELVNKVLKLNIDRGSDFVVQTSVGAAGVRGTDWGVATVGGAMYVDVLEGTIAFSSTASMIVLTTSNPLGQIAGVGAEPKISVLPPLIFSNVGSVDQSITTEVKILQIAPVLPGVPSTPQGSSTFAPAATTNTVITQVSATTQSGSH